MLINIFFITLWLNKNLCSFAQIFFEGVQDCIAAGVKEDEVGYQLAFSKQELRKCIKEYPAKELKKGLEQLYKKVEKHLCEEENLLQVCLEIALNVNTATRTVNFSKGIFKSVKASGVATSLIFRPFGSPLQERPTTPLDSLLFTNEHNFAQEEAQITQP